MAIGKNSRKSSVRSSMRAPKFLDKSNGFYGRLDEPEGGPKDVEVSRTDMGENVEVGVERVEGVPRADETEKPETSEYNEEVMGDDGETLLRRKPSRLSSRWRRRSSRKKQKEGRAEENQKPNLESEDPSGTPISEGTGVMMEVKMEKMKEMDGENEKEHHTLVHFVVREDEDDQVLIRDKKRGREDMGEEERRMKREQEEGLKMVKRGAVKNYGKTLDRAFRRGWEAFITNLYSVTLVPVTSSSMSSSSPSSKQKMQHKSVLAEFQ
ncbi:uncharacterized protein DDB_G0283697 [Antennarius striatus]|uniref:uncharacterized protein DDB_G0283697 n=1 Tax=Antennarius striatus TaxID=241820 RepID=UPI0035AFBCB0